MDTRIRRRRIGAGLAVLAVLAIVVGVIVGTSGGSSSRPPVLLPGGANAGNTIDPLAYTPALAGAYEQRAAAGYAHVLYAKSPGGVLATARRVAALRPLVLAAARATGADPNRLEAIAFLESAGRADALASSTPGAAAGLTQILGETGRDLLGLRVDETASARLTSEIAVATARGERGRAATLRAARRRVDQRFDPGAALVATGRYLAIAKRDLGGRDDLATESYHMGIGNLESVLHAYDGGSPVPYVQLFFDSSTLHHASAWSMLDALGDDSDTYLWRVLAAQEIMSLYRQQPARLAQLVALQGSAQSAEHVLHPPALTAGFTTSSALRAAYASGALVALPDAPVQTAFAIDPAIGAAAQRLGQPASLYSGLRPAALALLRYMAVGVRSLIGKVAPQTPLTITAMVQRDPSGWAFDVSRDYTSEEQARAFQFWLDRLQALNLIAWIREPTVIHVSVAADAGTLLPTSGTP